MMLLPAEGVSRTLIAEERETLVGRWGTLGAERLDDVRRDLPAEALAAWLHDPAAT